MAAELSVNGLGRIHDGVVGVTDPSVLDVNAGAGAAVVAIALGAVVVLAWLWRHTAPNRIRPAASTMELRSEAPAVVDMLTGGFDVDDDAVPATAVDLAARGWFTIEEIGGDRTIFRLRQRPPVDDRLTPFEERVMRHITKHADDGIVPAPVLTIGAEGVSQRWFNGFVREVTKAGRDAELCRRRWGFKQVAAAWGLTAVALAPAGLLVAFADRTNDPAGWGSIGNLLLGLALLIGLGMVWLAGRITRGDAQVDLPAGREAAAHWLGVREFFRGNGRFEDKPAASVAIWDRYLAYATAMGLAPVVQRQIPFETEHDRLAWSRAGGHWRRVKIRYLSWRPGWGQHPGRIALEGAVQAVVFGFIAWLGFYVASVNTDLDTLTAEQRQWIGLGGLIVAALAAAAVIFALIRVVLGVSDLFVRRTVEGTVVRRRDYKRGHRLPKLVQWMMFSGRDSDGMRRDRHRKHTQYLAIDPGDVDEIVAYKVRSSIFGQADQGARVRAQVSPRLGYVADIEVTAPPPTSAADEPGVLHPLAAEAVDAATSAVSARLGGAMAAIAQMTDDEGRPILDQTDDEGVSYRERLLESNDQLDRLRNDPEIAASPMMRQLFDALDIRTPTEAPNETADADEVD